jgi:hypothetical protein
MSPNWGAKFHSPGHKSIFEMIVTPCCRYPRLFQVAPRSCSTRNVTLRVTFVSGGAASVARDVVLPLRCRLRTQSFLFTFLDHDTLSS